MLPLKQTFLFKLLYYLKFLKMVSRLNGESKNAVNTLMI